MNRVLLACFAATSLAVPPLALSSQSGQEEEDGGGGGEKRQSNRPKDRFLFYLQVATEQERERELETGRVTERFIGRGILVIQLLVLNHQSCAKSIKREP